MIGCLLVCSGSLCAQVKNGNLSGVLVDSLATHAPADTLVERSGREAPADSLSRRVAFCCDSLRYRLNHPVHPEVSRFDYDSFRESMKEPWLGGLLKDLLFR